MPYYKLPNNTFFFIDPTDKLPAIEEEYFSKGIVKITDAEATSMRDAEIAARPRLELEKNVKSQRNQLLKDSDWTQLPDVPQLMKNDWATYRQALRDITLQPGFPNTVNWPNKPSN